MAKTKISNEASLAKKIRHLILAIGLAAGCVAAAQASNDAKMDAFISDLLSKMTLQEKIGQLNLPPGGDIVTGEKQSNGGWPRPQTAKIHPKIIPSPHGKAAP